MRAPPTDHQRQLGQFFTPRWAAEAIVARYFQDLPAGATVLEPTCGDGAFLFALPPHVNAVGIEIDPVMADRARQRTGRQVLVGDILHAPLPETLDAVVGNPPFHADTISQMLARFHTRMTEGGRCGLILPAYIFQTSTKVRAMAERWSIQQELLPRNLFPGLSMPIVFGLFTKEQHRRLFGFFLYGEAAEVAAAHATTRAILERSGRTGSVWREAVNEAFDRMRADEAPLDALYRALDGKRPTANPAFQQQVRKVLQTYPEFESEQRGVWRRRRSPTSDFKCRV